MLTIMKASAGSGKTFQLAGTYIRLLLDSGDPYAYRHILAVTFTNKATEEMKSRILRDLAELSESNPDAGRYLSAILHDYGSFSVCTIDTFFQRTLKAFSREIGHLASYQVELDKKSLVHEAVDRVLDSLTENSRDILDWMESMAITSLLQGKKFRMDDILYKSGEEIKSVGFQTFVSGSGINPDELFSKDNLAEVRNLCDAQITSFKERLKECDPDYYAAHCKEEPIELPKKTQLSKASPELRELFGYRYSLYRTAWIVKDKSRGLGLAGEFLSEFRKLAKEKNVVNLDDSNTILKGIIDGSDAPFIYEKLGVRYNHFLLDEFQDTSSIQWENFLPLLHESVDNGNESLVVGDVKQSIYRWRGSDWKLLASQVAESFPESKEISLEYNWRSCPAVVNFNSSFYEFAARELDESMGMETGKFSLGKVYRDVSQKVKSSDDQQGCVRLRFVSKDEELDEVLSSVENAFKCGALPGDIAILVRNNSDGAEVASFLIGHDYPVLSNDSLAVKSSVIVRRLVSLLSYMDRPFDTVSTFFAGSMNVTFPEEYHSLVDLAENLLRQILASDPDRFAGETLYIQSFMDFMQDWCSVNGQNLMLFLKHWDESSPTISSPEDKSAIRIMTVHKSKGLEFPYVIFPFAEKIQINGTDTGWCVPETKGTPLEPLSESVFPVDLNKGTANTMFSGRYRAEQRMQAVDNLNIFYVATTRASKALDIISANPSANCVKAVESGKPFSYVRVSEVLYAYKKKCGALFGRDYDFGVMKRKSALEVIPFDARYVSIALNGPDSLRLVPSEEAVDFFSNEGVGAMMSARGSGIVLHDILSRVLIPTDLEKSAEVSVRDGVISEKEASEIIGLLKSRIDSHPEWFPENASGVRILNESTIIDRTGAELRPDRIIISGGEALVVDYKFGNEHKQKYRRQMQRYMSILDEMGYPDVRGFIWYVREDKVEEVTP